MKLRITKGNRKTLVEKRKLTQGGDTSKDSNPKAGTQRVVKTTTLAVNEAPEKPLPNVVKKSMGFPSVKKKPVELTKDPWVDNEDVEPHDFQVRMFYVYFHGEMVRNKNSHQKQYTHNSYEVADFILELDADGDLTPGSVWVSSDPIKYKKAKWYDFDIIMEAYEAKKEQADAEKASDKAVTDDETDLDDKRFYFRKDQYFQYVDADEDGYGTEALWSANDIAEYLWALSDEKLMDHEFTVRDTRSVQDASGMPTAAAYKDVADVPAIEKASRILMKKAKEDPTFRPGGGEVQVAPADIPLQTIDGIKVRIGTARDACPEWSPANSDKPFGNKQFDPFTTTARREGKWECNTALEQIAIEAIQDFVTMNHKPEQEVINTLIDVARSAGPEEPLHPEEDIDTLFRGTSREALTGAPYDPQAKDILQNIDFSEELGSTYFLKNKWVAFNYKGSFKMAFPVASWTDDMETSAQFAKGGPSVQFENARPFQFIYMTSPGSAKSVGGTFINFDELYKLDGNTKAVGSNLSDNFGGFGGYEAFDKEILLIGQEGSSIPLNSVYVNWDYLTDEKTLKTIKQELPEVYKKITELFLKKPDSRNKAILDEFHKWAQKYMDQIDLLWRNWTAQDASMQRMQALHRHNKKAAIQALRTGFSKGLFDYMEQRAQKLYSEIEKVRTRFSFEGKGTPWAKDPKHPWHGVEHKFFMAAGENKDDIPETLLMMQDKLKTLGTQVRGAKDIIWADLPDETEVIEEKQYQTPWHERYAKIEKSKGMRSKLTGANAGNKFVPATGMKNASTNDKSKSPPPGVGALEEGPTDDSCSVCGTAHEGGCPESSGEKQGFKLKIR